MPDKKIKGQEIIDKAQKYIAAAKPLAALLGAPAIAVFGLELGLQALENFMNRIKPEGSYTQEMINQEADAAIAETNARTEEYNAVDEAREEPEEATDLEDDDEDEE